VSQPWCTVKTAIQQARAACRFKQDSGYESKVLPTVSAVAMVVVLISVFSGAVDSFRETLAARRHEHSHVPPPPAAPPHYAPAHPPHLAPPPQPPLHIPSPVTPKPVMHNAVGMQASTLKVMEASHGRAD
jgi:hypothetical protein